MTLIRQLRLPSQCPGQERRDPGRAEGAVNVARLGGVVKEAPRGAGEPPAAAVNCGWERRLCRQPTPTACLLSPPWPFRPASTRLSSCRRRWTPPCRPAAPATPAGVVGGLALATVASGSGATHTCAIAAADSTAHCWGWARYGQLGSRPGETCATPAAEPCSRTPLVVSGGLKFLAISSGARHTCALAVDSVAYCWGHNDAGQLGTGTTLDTAGPVAVAGGLHFARLTLGFSHSCGLTAGGDAYCWGDNTFGQIGDTTRSQSSVPVHVVGGVIFTTLSAGSEHTCGVSTGNVAWCWGQNGSSELGAESSETCTTPTGAAVACSRRPLGVTTSQNFRSISSGGHFTCALTTNGKAYCWGNNSNGQLGTGNTSGSDVPVRVANQP